MYLTLLGIANDLSSFTFRALGKDFTPYSRFVILYRLYASTGNDVQLTSGANGSAAWTNLLSASGLSLVTTASDGVHRFKFLLAKTQAGATVDADGKLTFSGGVDTTGLSHVSLSTDPYVLYPYDPITGKVAGMMAVTNASVELYTTDENNILVMVQAERGLAADLRSAAPNGCDAVKNLMARFIELQTAMARFKCGDYQGAEALILNNSSTVNCGC